MSIRSGVLLMTSESATATAVAHTLTTNGHVLETTSAARDFPELIAQLQADPRAVALVDLDASPGSLMREMERAIEQFPGSRFVALAREVNSDLLLDAMQSGIRRVIAKESIAQELPAILDRLSPVDPCHSAESAGTIITVLSASGGCGATTIAANLAHEIAHGGPVAPAPASPVLAIDLDHVYGALSTYFGLAPQHAIDKVLHCERAPDAALLRASVSVLDAHLHLLASPASLRPPRLRALDFAHIGEMLALAGNSYGTVVVDAPRVMPDVLTTLVADSDVVVLAFQLSVKDLRTARGMLDVLEEHGIDRAHVLAVANRYAEPVAISIKDAATVLGVGEIVRLRNDYRAAAEGFNAGKPLEKVAPHSLARQDLLALRARISQATAHRA